MDSVDGFLKRLEQLNDVGAALSNENEVVGVRQQLTLRPCVDPQAEATVMGESARGPPSQITGRVRKIIPSASRLSWPDEFTFFRGYHHE